MLNNDEFGPVKIEPTADHRSAALNMRQLYVALCDEGFTDAQALALVGTMLRSAVGD